MKRFISVFLLSFLAVAGLARFGGASPAMAEPLITIPNGGSVGGYSGGITLGYEFSLSEHYLVNRIGFVDDGQDGLFESHQVGLWDASGTLVSSVIVPGGAAATLDGFTRWVDVETMLLGPGTYTAGAHFPTGSSGGGDLPQSNAGATTAQGVTLLNAKAAGSPGFQRPTNNSASFPGIFGPNLDGGTVSTLPATALVNVTSAGAASGYSGGITRGWELHLDHAQVLVDLGFFDFGQDGLVEEHMVGLWDSMGNLVTSVTIGAGTSSVLDGFFRYEAIAPILLSAGDYTLGAHYQTGSAAGDEAGVNNDHTFASGVTYLGSRTAGSPGFQEPTNGSGFANGIFGPNARFADTAAALTSVAEPGSIGLLGLALAGLGLAGLRRKTA